MEAARKFLVLRPRFLGDLILATGLIPILRRDHPDNRVWFLTESSYAEALEGHPDLSGVLSLDVSRKNNPFYLWGFYRRIRREKFDAVLDLFGNPRSAQMAFASGATVRVGFDLRGRRRAYNRIALPSSPPLPSGRRPVTEAYLDQVRALGIDPKGSYQTSLFLEEGEKSHARKLLERAGLQRGERLAALVPGASWPAKRWPLDRFLELAVRLQGEGVRPLFLFGPKEEALAAEFEGRMDKGWILINRPNLRGLLAFVEAADVLVANDSGPMHVGPAVGTPTLGIFGPGEPEVWFPYGPPHEAAYAEVPCSHCGLDRCGLMACMDRLEARDLAARALALMASSGGKKGPAA
jgi:ADP-heptose:LPS heptosyltransferase